MKSTPTLLLLIAASFMACVDEPCAEKPFVDPDETLETGKADRISNFSTTHRGPLTLGVMLEDSIDFPDLYLGRTTTLRAGQRIQVDLLSDRRSLVRVYGPAHGEVDGRPTFGPALVKADTRRDGSSHFSSFDFDAPADGIYMLVYGPKTVWAADYLIEATCTAGPCKGGLPLGEACELDEECDNGFCGCAAQACDVRVCKAFAAEGETCGGFRMAHLTTRCSPDFDCVAPYDIIADIPGHCGAMTTVAEVLANPTRFDGRYIGIKGLIDSNSAACTKIGCPIENMCCNACSAHMRVYDDKSQLGTEGIYTYEDGSPLSCDGNECNWREMCDIALGNYWVSGWFSMRDGITPSLDIERRFGWGR